MSPITIHLTLEEERMLRAVAQQERRSVRLQAEVLIRQALEDRGLLKPTIKEEVQSEQLDSVE